jgi:hypothetical protein
MSDIVDPRWPQEAHPWRDEAQLYRQRVAERALAQFKESSWRPSAVFATCQIFERLSETQSNGEKITAQAMIDAVLAASLIPTSDGGSAEAVAAANNLVFGLLLGEAAAMFLYRRTDRVAWSVVQGVLFNFDGMLTTFRICLQSNFQSDGEFRKRFNALADEIVSDSLVRPILSIEGRDRDNLLALVEHWRKSPDLGRIWSGLPEMRHSFYPSELDILSNIYLALDAARLAELLDRFDNPYQIWTVLTGFAWLGLDKKFAAWSALFRHAAPSFTDDGSWNKHSLEPLLLVIAQDALRHARLPKDAAEDLVLARQEELNSLTAAISRLIAARPHGASLSLRWSARLFRLSAVGTSDQEPYPQDLRQGVTPLWRMLEALARSDAAGIWNSIPVPDAAPEEILSLLAAKIVAANERNSTFPGSEPLLHSLPKSPENFLGNSGRNTRELTRLFSSYGGRPDSLKYRILSLLMLQGNPVSLYRDLWRRTLTLRELAEHWQTGEQSDGRMDAKEVLGMVLAIGLTTLDYYADSRSITDLNSPRTPEEFGELFTLVYDGLREVQAIELFNQPFWTNLYMHLLVRRALYENAHVGDFVTAAWLSPDIEPTLATMLVNAAGVTPIFFDCLDSLIRNRISIERVVTALQLGDVDLAALVAAARRLNEIDERRPYRIETAAKIAAEMSR